MSARGLAQSEDAGHVGEVRRKPNLVVVRLTEEDLSAVIRHRQFHHFPGTNVTVCALTLANGFVVIGYSACASEFDDAVGKQIAFDNARDKLWELEGYRLRQRMHEAEER